MSGNRLTIANDLLTVEPLHMDKIWSFTRRLEIPLAHVVAASFDPTVISDPQGLRFPGLRIPGKASGTFYADGKRQFWNITGYHSAIVIELNGAERYDRLVLTVADPLAEVDAIESAIAGPK